jgi:hypothetical protein
VCLTLAQVFDEIVNQLLTANPKLDKNNLLSMIEQKKQDSHGLLSDEGAVRLVAQQLAIVPLSNIGLQDQRIRSVHVGLNDVTVTGGIISLGEPYEFDRADGSHGKLLRIRLTDGSGELTCIFWDNHVDLVIREALAPGCQVRILHGYTRNGKAGEVEFHLGNKSSFQILSRKSFHESMPTNHNSHAATPDFLKLQIVKIKKSRSENGPTWALCQSDGGLVIAKFWEHGSAMLQAELGSWFNIEQPWLEEKNGILYVNVGSKSTVKVIDNMKPDTVIINLVKLNALKPGSKLWAITGRVVDREEVREIQTKEGRKVKVSNLGLDDGTGKIRISCWDRQAEETAVLRIGDSIRLTGIRVRQNMNGENEASTVFLSSIEKLQSQTLK